MMEGTHKRNYMVDIWKDVEEVPYTGFPACGTVDELMSIIEAAYHCAFSNDDSTCWIA